MKSSSRQAVRLLPWLVAASLYATAAQAELPPHVEAMIREAARVGNDQTVAAVVEVAKSLNPEQAEEIVALGETLKTGLPVIEPAKPAIAPPVEAMITEAARSGNAETLTSVIAIARATNPDDAAAIDFLGATLLAQAAPPPAIPPTVEAMIREAWRVGDATTLASVVKVAKSNNPDDVRAIEILGAELMGDIQTRQREAATRAREAEQARLAALGMFDGWTGQGELGAGLTTGNTDQVNALIGLRLAKEGLRARHKFAASLDYQQTDGLRTRERYAANYGLNYLLGDGLYISSTLGWERDEFAGFSRRFTESIGLGVRLIDRPRMTLDVDGGPALRQTLFIDGTSDDEFGARGSLTYRWTIRNGFTFSEDASIVSSDGNTTIISASALAAKITEYLSTRVSFNVQSETQPLPGRKPTDTATRVSVIYSF
jgi:putative salt-induced outer membrane protein